MLQIILFSSIFILSIFKIQAYDIFYLLKTGQWILTRFAIPYQDPFSYTATLPWVAHVWLAGVVFHVVELIAGINGLVVFNSLLILLAFYLLFRAAENWGGGVIITSTLVFLAFMSARVAERLFIRAEIFSLVLIAAYLLILSAYKFKGKNFIFLLPVLQLFWANLHAGSVMGIGLVFLFAAGEFVNSGFKFDRRIWLILLIMIAAALVNPYGLGSLTYFLHTGGQEFSAILEWRKTNITDLFSPFGMILLLGVISFLPKIKKMDFADAFLFLGFGLLSTQAIRLIAPFSLVAVPVIAGNLEPSVKKIKMSKNWAAILLSALILIITFVTLAQNYQKFGSNYKFGLGLNEEYYPEDAVRFIDDNKLSGNMFNNYGFGAYLIWKYYPQRKVFIDGRFDLYGDEFVGLYRRFTFKEVWDYLVKRYDLAFALLDNEPTYICRNLDRSPDWKLVYWDDRSLIYVRDIPENRNAIEKHAYKYLRPNDRTNQYLDQYLDDPKKAAVVIAEVKRSDPKILNAHLILGYIYERLNDLPAAAGEYRYILSVMPDFQFAKDKLRMIEGLRLLKI